MKAAYMDRYGTPEVLTVRDIPAPKIGPNEVLIRQAASNVSPADCAFRSADPFIVRFFTGLLRPTAPIPGETVAGTIEAVGADVTRFTPGDRVFGISELAMGALAELVGFPEDSAIVRMPEGLGFEEAGGLPYGYLTALPFLRDEAKLQPGQRILINGAAGSVGIVAVQLARNMAAHVTAVCSTHNVELLLSLGADEVIDRTKLDFTSARASYDVIFDAVGRSSFPACRAALKPGGIYLTTVPTWAILWQMLRKGLPEGKRAKLATTGLRKPAAKRADMQLLAETIERGEVRGVIDEVFPLRRIADAHRYVELGTKAGDVIITIP
ncbi:MAG: NAD(P)-dependent alcohol dehydrogenase [Devosia sp.]